MSDETARAVDEDSPGDEWVKVLEEQAKFGETAVAVDRGSKPEQGSPKAGLDNLTAEPPNDPQQDNLARVLEIPITLSMEIGRTKLSIRNLLQLNRGSVVELDRLAGEPLDVLVNGTLVARGEVVVVNEKFGIRVTDVVSPLERIKKLR